MICPGELTLPRSFRWLRIGLIAVTALLAVTAIAVTLLATAYENRIDEASRYNRTFDAAQTLSELLRLQLAFVRADGPDDLDELELRAAILENRTTLLDSVTFPIADMRSEIIPRLAEAIREIKPLLDRMPNPDVAAHAVATLDPLVTPLARMTSRSHAMAGDEVARTQTHLRFVFASLCAVTLMLVLFGAALVIFVLKQNRRLDRTVRTDTLTGLANRLEFGLCLDRLAAGRGCAVVLIDVDHFKMLNDMYGHDVGDAVLGNVSRHLTRAASDAALVARIGGDEFAVLYEGNRNKRSIVIDIGRPEGREILLRMLEEADVLVHNFKPGAMEKWDLEFETVLRPRFPSLVLCHVTGFGKDGPLGGFPGYDAVVQAMTGLMSINGVPGGGPVRMGTPIVDIGTGLIACNAILAALFERSRSGLGQSIEVSLFDSAISMLHPQAANCLMSGMTPVSTGNAHPNIAPYDMFPTRTKPIYLAVGNKAQFAKLCEHLDIPDAPRDPRFADNSARLAHREELTLLLGSRLAEGDAETLESELLSKGVPAGVVRGVDDALAHPHTAHRGMVVEHGGYRGTGILARLGRTPGNVRNPTPRFGQHTATVLLEVGYTEGDIDRLSQAGIVKNAAVEGPGRAGERRIEAETAI